MKIEGRRFVKDGKPVYLLVDFEGKANVCNARFVGRARNEWPSFGAPLSQGYKDMFRGQVNALKRDKKIAVIQLFSALYFRGSSADGRPTGVESTVWWDGGVDESWQRFVSPEAVTMQRELMDFVIGETQQAGVDFTFSLMWESQVLGGRPEFLPWFTGHKKYLAQKYNIPVGMHSHKPPHIAAADFCVIEGDYAEHLHMFDIDKPVVILARNPGKFTPGNKCRTYDQIVSWQAVARKLQAEMLEEFKRLGSTGYPYPRWVNLQAMEREYRECSDETRQKMSRWDFAGFDRSISNFCTQLLEAAKTGNFDSLSVTVEPSPEAQQPVAAPTPAPTTEEGVALQVKGKRFVKDRKPVYLLVGKANVCNAEFIGGEEDQWERYGGALSPAYKQKFRKKLDSLKNTKIAVIQLFSTRYFRQQRADGRASGSESIVWWGGDVEETWKRFIAAKGVKMQRELIDFVIGETQEAGVDFTFSLMRKSQAVDERPEFLPWFKAHREYVTEKYDIPVGIHSHKRPHIAAADFAVIEDDYAGDFGMFDADKPVVILARNPANFSLADKCATYNDDWQAVAKQLQTEMAEEFKQLGSTGYPHKRWLDKDAMKKDLKKCPDKLNRYDFSAFKKSMNAFCRKLLEAAKTGNFDTI